VFALARNLALLQKTDLFELRSGTADELACPLEAEFLVYYSLTTPERRWSDDKF